MAISPLLSWFEEMIKIIEHDGKQLVSSLEVYKKAGYNLTHYSRWVKMGLYNMGKKDVDYFDITEPCDQDLFFPKTWSRKTRSAPEVYFLTINTAITICFMAKTESAKRLKLFLQLNKSKTNLNF